MDSDENMSNPPEDGDGDIESEIEAASTVEALQQEEEQQFIVSQKDQHEIDTEENIKLAPSYFVIRACADKDEDWPGPRCGHTLTAVAAIGEEGSPSYVGPRLVLFGGATALEGNTPPPSPAGIAGIRLAEVTADVHCFDILSKKWSRLHPAGPAPSPRAAHAATAVGPMVVIQGGIGPAGFSTEDLHVLDLSSSQPRWHRVVVQGSGPGPRYGHVLCLFEQRFLLSICGNDGKSLLADVWALDTAAKPYEWRKLEPGGDGPRPCMYAAASTRVDGLLVICGGRDSNNVPLSSAHALGRKDDGSWEWATATGISPAPRYQHAAAFVNSRLHVSGGAYGRGHIVDDASSVVVLDTVAQLWCDKKSVLSKPGRYKSDQLGGVEMMRRCRHAAAAVGDHIYIYGGLKAGALLSDLLMADDRLAPEAPTSGIREARAALTSSSSRMMGDGMPMDGYVDGATLHHSDGGVEEQPSADTYDNSSTVANMNHVPGHWNRKDTNVDVLVEASAAEAEAISSTMAKVNAEYQLSRSSSEKESGNLSGLTNNASRRGLVASDVRLHHRAVVVSEAAGGVLGGLVRQLSIDQFENEGRRVEIAGAAKKLLDRQMSTHGTHKKVLSSLLKPRGWRPPVRRQFFLDFSEVRELCDTVEKLFMKEPNVLRLKAPIKIFGDLHGQFGDLMRLFDEYGSPSTAGDISYIDYLFLGDYVDRGQHSLETILLLLALKIEHPYHVHLIRGNHEAADINALFGFRTECIERMGEREGIWAWQRVNQLFNWLPLSALIEDRIICMHGGIGRSINYVGQIDSLQRPITMDTGSVVLMDLLWSDPTENDSVEGLRPNARGPGLVTFGPDRVMEFCRNNDLQLIIRAHECVMDGFERFAQGHLITLFSATNYCGTANNAGAILVLGRDMVVVPKLIHPIPPALHSGELSLDQYSDEAWMQELNVQRPPTPTRGRPQPSNGRTSLAFI